MKDIYLPLGKEKTYIYYIDIYGYIYQYKVRLCNSFLYFASLSYIFPSIPHANCEAWQRFYGSARNLNGKEKYYVLHQCEEYIERYQRYLLYRLAQKRIQFSSSSVTKTPPRHNCSSSMVCPPRCDLLSIEKYLTTSPNMPHKSIQG